jgi:hypothetical protein
MIGLILAQALNGVTRACSSNREPGFVHGCFAPEWNPRLAGKYIQEALPCSFQARLFIAFERDAEIPIDTELIIPRHSVGR